jgi:glycosyltransferase involved in cell wall biosynthesis
MCELGHKITYIAVNGEGQGRYAEELRKLGVDVFAGDPVMMQKKGFASSAPAFDLKSLLIERQFDVAWLSFYHVAEDYSDSIRAYSPSTKIIVDSVDIHFLREQRRSEVDKSITIDQVARLMMRELKVYEDADLAVCVTPSDQVVVTRLSSNIKSDVIPNVHPQVKAIEKEFEERSDILFVGNFNHPPNADGIIWFVANVWPLVQPYLPSVKLHIIGPNPPSAVQSLRSTSVIIHGWVADIDCWLQSARLSIAPLRYGAGMKGKIGEAMAHGLPVITTPIGAEGMPARAGEDLEVVSDVASMAHCIVDVYTNREKWSRLSKNGQQMIELNYGTGAVKRKLVSLLTM